MFKIAIYIKDKAIEHVQSDCGNWPDLARVHREETIQEDKNANQGGRDQHTGVPAQPGKVQTDFLTKVPPGKKTGRSKFNNKLRRWLVKLGGKWINPRICFLESNA